MPAPSIERLRRELPLGRPAPPSPRYVLTGSAHLRHPASPLPATARAALEVVLIRTIIRDAVPDLTMPAAAVLAEAATGANDQRHHDAVASLIPALHQIEIRQPLPRARPRPRCGSRPGTSSDASTGPRPQPSCDAPALP